MKEKKKNSMMMNVISFLIIAGLCFGTYWFFYRTTDTEPSVPATDTTIQVTPDTVKKDSIRKDTSTSGKNN